MKHAILEAEFRPGDIVVFHDDDKDNPSYHYSRAGRLVRYAQSFYSNGDPTVIHVGLIHEVNRENPKPGETDMLIIDALIGTGVDIRPLIRNYKISVFRLKEGIPGFDSAEIARTARDVALQCKGMDYSKWRCWEVFQARSTREESILNEQYPQWLSNRLLFDPVRKTIYPDTIGDGMMCAELVITSYQMAWLKLADNHANTQIPPPWIRLHAHSRPANLFEFLSTSGFYERINPEAVRQLRYSGIPDPRDQSMTIMLYIPPSNTPPPPPAPMTWTEWVYTYLASLPLMPTLPSFSLLNAILQAPNNPVTLALEMQPRITERPLKFDDYEMVDLSEDANKALPPNQGFKI
jgi:hypothetical protein